LFQYALNHHKIEWIDQLAKLQFQRAQQYMKELRQDGKEYAKNCRLGRKDEVKRVVQKYGPDFAPPDTGLTGLMLALYHGQDAVADLLLQSEADINLSTANGLLPFDYLLQGYYKSVLYKQSFVAGKNILLKYWHTVRPSFLTVQVQQRKLNIGAHSMAFFLLVCMRCIEQEVPEKVTIKVKNAALPERTTGVFSMDTMMRFMECMPDEILPTYRKQRQYVNSVLSLHEVERESPYNKKLFARVKRGSYIINPQLVFESQM